MPTFFDRKYARRIETVGPTEKIVGSVILVLMFGLVAAFVAHAITPAQTPVHVAATATSGLSAGPDSAERSGTAGAATGGGSAVTGSRIAGGTPPCALPDLDLDGWEVPARVFQYGPDTLHEKINGRAEIYLHYGVVGLTFGTYRDRTNAGRQLDVYWYHMTDATGARAVYEAEAPPSMPPLEIGERAYRAGGAVFFQRGVHYVQVLPSSLDEGSAAAAEEVARQMAECIGPAPEDP
jgi:hypothetical protein